MLSDPLVATYNSVAVNMPRVSLSGRKGPVKQVSSTTYRSATGDMSAYITRHTLAGNITRFEVIFERVQLDDGNPGNGITEFLPNRYGVVYEVNDLKGNTATDIPLLKSALNAFLNTATESRILAGES